MIKGLYETHLNVSNLNRSIDFYSNTLELELCHYIKERRVAFFWMGEPKQSMLGIWEKKDSEIERRHFAFECDPKWILNDSVKYLKNRGIKSYNFLKDEKGEPLVFAWMPAIAIYFEDPDGHYLEFIGILKGESKPENGILTYEKWLEMEKN